MSAGVFAVCFLFGAMAVALWIDARFPSLAPQNLRSALLHVGGTIVAAQVLIPLGLHAIVGSPTLTLLSVFGLAFPGLTYTMLAGIWVIRLVANIWRGLSR